MYRFRNYRLFRLYSNTFDSFVAKSKLRPNVCSLVVNTYSSDAIDVSKVVNINKSLSDLCEKRLQILSRSLPVGDHDILSESIIKCGSVEQLLELISMHSKVMNNRHLSEVFETLNDVLRMSDDFRRTSLRVLSSQQFRQLCNQTVKQMRFFQTSQIVTTFKTLTLLEVSPNTNVIQSLLQMTRQLINDFSINEIVFLDFLLSKNFVERSDVSEVDNYMRETNDYNKDQKPVIVPLVEALRLAIPLVLQLKIENKELDYDDLESVVKCLRMAAKHHMKSDVVTRLTAAVSRGITELSITNCYSVIAALNAISFTNPTIASNLTDRVLNECLERVTAPGHPIPDTSYNFVVSLITHNNRPNFYHKGLNEMVANLIIENPNKFHISKVGAVLFSLTRQLHVHYGLLDFVADRIAEGSPDFILNPKMSFTNILTAFSLPSDYRPNGSDCEVVYRTILDSNHIQICKQTTKHLLFKILKSFSLLNYYPKEEIIDWFDRHFDDALSLSTQRGLRIDFIENIRIIYQGLCTESDIDCLDLKEKLKPFIEEWNEFMIKEMENFSKSKTLETALVKGLGGNQFVAKNMFSKFGHIVDYVVVMRKGGYPVAIASENQEITDMSQLDVPSDSKIFGIIGLTFKDFCRQPMVRKAETDFKLRSLKNCGIIPIPINLEGWEEMAEIEKIPFIMRELHEMSDSSDKQNLVNAQDIKE